jgi:PAS domain S-box-containing protein
MIQHTAADSSELTFLRNRVAELEAKATDLARDYDREHLLKVSQRLTKSGGWQWHVGKEAMTWTEETYRIHDIDPEQLVQGSPEHITLSKACYSPEDQPKIMVAFQRCIELGEPYDLEFSFTTHKGRKLWIRTTAEAVWEEGRVARAIGNILDITERKLVELKLRENEQALKAILNAAPETISLIDSNGTILMANRTMASRLQRSVEELIGHNAYDFFPPTIARQRKASARQVVETGKAVVLVDERDGRALESHLWPVFDETGCVSRIAVFALDITERKRMDEYLKINEERFRLTFDCSPVGMAMVGPDFKFLRINDSFCQLVGYSENELKNLSFADITHPDDQQQDIEQVTRLLAGEIELYDVEKRYLHKSGETIWARINVALVRDAEHRPLFFLPIIQNITERKQAMEHLHKQADFTRRILDSTDDHLAILDEQGRIIDVNNAWTRFEKENCRATETIGIGISYFCNWSKDYGDTSFAAEAFAGILRVQKGELDSFQIIYPCHSPTENRWFNMKVLPLSGTRGHVLVAHSNITLQKQAEERLTVALQEKDVLLREVHHRVKNNMAAIIGLFNLQRQNIVEPHVQTILGELSSRVKAMSLVHEKLYRSESVTRIDFQDYLQSLILHLQTSFSAPGIRFEVKTFGVGMPLDLAVPCGMIVNELITNAIKYAFPGKGPATAGTNDCISITMTRDNDTLSLSVADNGVGLPPGFDFDTTKTIGLALVRMLGRHQLGGQYVLDRNGGTRFTLAFSLGKLEKAQ